MLIISLTIEFSPLLSTCSGLNEVMSSNSAIETCENDVLIIAANLLRERTVSSTS